MPEKQLLKIQMLGGFSLSYNNTPIVLERSSVTKATQLLQYLTYHINEKIPRNTLINMLYGNDDIGNPANNLKVNLFRLRKILASSCLPEGEYIIFKSGMYSFSPNLPVEIDCKVFSDFVNLAKKSDDDDEKSVLLQRAINLYTGEFLPMLSTEPWVVVENVKYYDEYLYCIKEAYRILKKSGDFNLLFDICSRAASIYPYDEEIQMFKISCLIDMERFLDAKEAYDEVAKRFFEDLGISPSNNMKELYNKRLGNIQLTISDVAKIKELIKEKDNTKGAYYCNYLGFIDSYRFIARVVERSGQSIYLSLFTLTDTKGKPLETGEKLTEAVKSLHSVIANSLRRGDLYTRYSQNQFLVLLVGINYENCSVVSNRIFSNFDELKIRGIRLSAASISGTDVEQPKNKEPLKFLNTAKWQ